MLDFNTNAGLSNPNDLSDSATHLLVDTASRPNPKNNEAWHHKMRNNLRGNGVWMMLKLGELNV